MRLQNAVESSILALLTLVIYLFTINPVTKPYAIYALAALLLVVGILYLFVIRKSKDGLTRLKSKVFIVLVFTLVTAVLLWIGNTGWFLSPFFYLLYLVGISLGMLFSTSAAFSFVIVLIAILMPQVGTLSTEFDLITAGSLFLIVPLSYFLGKAYLKVKEKEKKILVLQTEHHPGTLVEEILQNKVTKLSAKLREPINDIKQLAYFEDHQKTKEEADKTRDRIITASEQALQILKEFEEETTGKEFLHSPEAK